MVSFWLCSLYFRLIVASLVAQGRFKLLNLSLNTHLTQAHLVLNMFQVGWYGVAVALVSPWHQSSLLTSFWTHFRWSVSLPLLTCEIRFYEQHSLMKRNVLNSPVKPIVCLVTLGGRGVCVGGGGGGARTWARTGENMDQSRRPLARVHNYVVFTENNRAQLRTYQEDKSGVAPPPHPLRAPPLNQAFSCLSNATSKYS